MEHNEGGANTDGAPLGDVNEVYDLSVEHTRVQREQGAALMDAHQPHNRGATPLQSQDFNFCLIFTRIR